MDDLYTSNDSGRYYGRNQEDEYSGGRADNRENFKTDLEEVSKELSGIIAGLNIVYAGMKYNSFDFCPEITKYHEEKDTVSDDQYNENSSYYSDSNSGDSYSDDGYGSDLSENDPEPDNSDDLRFGDYISVSEMYEIVNQCYDEDDDCFRNYNGSARNFYRVSKNEAEYIIYRSKYVIPNKTSVFQQSEIAQDLYDCSLNLIRGSNRIKLCTVDISGNVVRKGSII